MQGFREREFDRRMSNTLSLTAAQLSLITLFGTLFCVHVVMEFYRLYILVFHKVHIMKETVVVFTENDDSNSLSSSMSKKMKDQQSKNPIQHGSGEIELSNRDERIRKSQDLNSGSLSNGVSSLPSSSSKGEEISESKRGLTLKVPSAHSEALNIDSFSSVYNFTRDVSTFGLILLFAFFCENYPLHPHGQKEWDRDMYYFLTILLFAASYFSMKKGKTTDILNREQTEEWKGWMQFMFLTYHYFHASEVYNAIRIMITCYVWMTGFGNFSFFYLKQDFSIVRMIQMFWRLNFLVFFLCMGLNNTYILYYICPLHTFYFFVVFAIMKCGSKYNHGKWDIRIKLFIASLIIYLIWDAFDSKVFEFIFWPVLSTNSIIGAPAGTLWEWYFRSSLDHWSTLFGMIFALNYPFLKKSFQVIEEQNKKIQFIIKGSVGIVLGGTFIWWALKIFTLPKFSYNVENPYFGMIPLLSYIYFRNINIHARSYYANLLHELGKITLETYLLQHHLWLTSNAKTLLILIPNSPKINLFVTGVIYLVLSQKMYRLTMSLRGMILPDDRKKCLTGASAFIIVMVSFYIFGLTLKGIKGGENIVIPLVAIILLSSALLVVFFQRGLFSYENGYNFSNTQFSFIDRFCRTFYLPCLQYPGKLFLALIATFFYGIAIKSNFSKVGVTNDGKEVRLLSTPQCLHLLNEGKWQYGSCREIIPLITSNSADGKDVIATEKNFYASKYAHCDVKSWEWPAEGESCQFHEQTSLELAAKLNGKNISFVGDSIARENYYALLSELGDPSINEGDPNQKYHADLTSKNGSIHFFWRPLLEDVNSLFQVWGNENFAPDILIIHVGLHDVLSKHDPDIFESILESIYNNHKQKIKKIPVSIWITPTAIVNQNLQTDEKKTYMTEEKVKEYRNLEISSQLVKTFKYTLDGFALTKDIGQLSFDGVHYNEAIYSTMMQFSMNAYDLIEGSQSKGLTLSEENKPKSKGTSTKFPDGSTVNFTHGSLILIVIILMLVTCDSYAGIISLFICIFAKKFVTWTESYEPLLRKLGISLTRIQYNPVPVDGSPGRSTNDSDV